MNEKLQNDIDAIVKKAHQDIDNIIKEHEKYKNVNIDDCCTINTNRDGIVINTLYGYCAPYKKRVVLNNNVFETQKEALKYAEIDQKVREYIYKENLKNPLNWKDEEQKKYFLFYNNFKGLTEISKCNFHCYHNVLYCSNKNMLNGLLKIIYQDDLDWYVNHPAISELKFDLDNL
jgi:hypothetical protein